MNCHCETIPPQAEGFSPSSARGRSNLMTVIAKIVLTNFHTSKYDEIIRIKQLIGV